MGGGDLAHTGVQSMDFRARRDLLYRLRYPDPIVNNPKVNILQMQLFSIIWERQKQSAILFTAEVFFLWRNNQTRT
jgi:hypothetical protein